MSHLMSEKKANFFTHTIRISKRSIALNRR